MLIDFWNEFLYRPLFNVLIWMYNNWTDANLGWAVVYLTISLRVFLMPFTVITERNKIRNKQIFEKIKKVDKIYKNDQVLKKEEMRKLLKMKKIRPWSSAFELGTQLLVLILLYQVFLRGITGEKVKILRLLYDWVDYPGAVNTIFYGFNLGTLHDWFWPGIVAIFFWLYIYMEYKRYRFRLTGADLAYFVLFPLGSFFLLWLLPMVKSLFILTSLIFSTIIHQLVRLFVRPKKIKDI